VLHSFVDQGGVFVYVERVAAVEHLVEDDTDGKHVAFVGEPSCLIAEYFWAAVGDGESWAVT
jgi:hypothetical protein